MKLNQLPNLRVEDFQSEQAWIGRLFVQLNPFIQAVNQIFLLNIDYTDNIKAVTRAYSISSFQSFSFLWTWPETPPVELRVVKSSKGSGQTPCILLPAWSYDSTNATITVSSMVEVSSSGAAALSGSYTFTVRATI